LLFLKIFFQSSFFLFFRFSSVSVFQFLERLGSEQQLAYTGYMGFVAGV